MMASLEQNGETVMHDSQDDSWLYKVEGQGVHRLLASQGKRSGVHKLSAVLNGWLGSTES